MTLPEAPRPSLRLAAAAMLAAEIVIHGYLAPDHLREVPYVGVLFVAVSVLLTIVLVGILTRPRAAAVWHGGAVVCLGMALAFVASRTVGLPGLRESWISDAGLGLVSLPPEVVFVICALSAARDTRRAVGCVAPRTRIGTTSSVSSIPCHTSRSAPVRATPDRRQLTVEPCGTTRGVESDSFWLVAAAMITRRLHRPGR